MKRLSALLTAALLSACTQTPEPVTPQTVALGRALSTSASQSFGGSWSIEKVPDWLSVSPSSGKGDVSVNFTADRSRGTPVSADQPRLSGEVTVVWKNGSASGRTVWTVTADQYTVTGRVMDAASVQATDVEPEGRLGTQSAGEARGVIVKYRSAAAQAVALGRAVPVTTLSEAAQDVTRGTLTRLDVPRGERRDLGSRAVLLETADVAGALRSLQADPNVEYAVPNAVLHAQGLGQPVVPTDQYAGLQWAYKLLGYGAVWRDMEAGGYTRPVTVAVIDTGVRFDHPDLQGVLYGPGEGALDVVTSSSNGDGNGPDTDPTDPDTPGRSTGSHGTHVTGIIAARWGKIAPYAGCGSCSTSGVVGAAYRASVKVLPIRVIDTADNATTADVVNAVRYAAGLTVTLGGKTYTSPHPAAVINLSLGGPVSAEEARPLCGAVAEVTARGALVVAAAGNGYGSEPYYPAACEGAVAVASVTLSGASAPVHAEYSNSYPQVMLSAPGGVDVSREATFYNGGSLNGKPYPDVILSTDWDYAKDQPTYYSYAGTSQATPQVSALAALLLSKGVTKGRDDTLARMVATTTDLGEAGRDEAFGYGMINPAAALGNLTVSNTLGLRVQGNRGSAFQPTLDALGRFTAYLPDGTFSVIGGRDRDGDGIYGGANEPRDERRVSIGPDEPQAALGELTPGP
ncbi:S8 family serine peptidase [Deinococcus apachensis]|uniref:S8 family serine peptidase n=1 Tax=Deinococcus apachensis TaxID=309886 RepID=UPI00035F115E|nr:S8 family serine peptidase [Deinococcus apachensis]